MLRVFLFCISSLFHDYGGLHLRVERARVGKAAGLREGMSPDGIRSDWPGIERGRRGRMLRDIIVLPFYGIPFFNFNCRRRKFHVLHGHMREHRHVGVCDRALDGARRSSARLISLQSRLGWRRVAPINVRGGKVGAVAARKKSCKEEDEPQNDQDPEGEGLDRNASVTFFTPNGAVQFLHILLSCVIDPLAVALQGGLAHSEKPRRPEVRFPWNELGMRFKARASVSHLFVQRFLKSLRVLQMGFEDRLAGFQERLQFRVLGVWQQDRVESANH